MIWILFLSRFLILIIAPFCPVSRLKKNSSIVMTVESVGENLSYVPLYFESCVMNGILFLRVAELVGVRTFSIARSVVCYLIHLQFQTQKKKKKIKCWMINFLAIRILLWDWSAQQPPLRGGFNATSLSHLLRGTTVCVCLRTLRLLTSLWPNIFRKSYSMLLLMQYLFDSLKETRVMKCGHTMHCDCYHEMLKRDK